MKTNRFTGPLFIVGMDRSGTKLIRDLLNRSTKIGIPVIESNCFPYLIRRFGNPPKFRNNDEFDRFFEVFSQTTFYWLVTQSSGRLLRKDYISKAADKTSWASIFEVILRFYAPDGRDKDFIYGDKTPAYLKHMKLLKDLHPEARFLHIIRDPRDVCLSEKKTWGKSLYRTANRWRETIERGRTTGSQFGKDYMEIFYESLLESPKKVLFDICKFIDCEFTVEMTKLEKPSENFGDARGKAFIVQDNMKKYITQLSSHQIRRIEEIVYPIAKSIGYELENDVEYVPLSPLNLKMLRVYNAWVSAKHYIKVDGLTRGLWLLAKEVSESMPSQYPVGRIFEGFEVFKKR
jgi:hypothetical protein